MSRTPSARQSRRDTDAAAYSVGAALVLPGVLWALLLLGHHPLDRPEPDLDGARTWFAVAAAAAGLSLAVGALLVWRLRVWHAAWGVLTAGPATVLVAFGTASYDDGWVMGVAMFTGGLLASTVVAGFWSLGRSHAGPRAPLPLLGHLVAWSLAALLGAVAMLADLPRQAEEARAAHATPLGLLVPLLALAAALATRRRAAGRRQP